MASPLGGASFSEDSRRGIAVIDAMTLEERRSPEAVAQPRRGEIAAAAGVAVDFVEAVLALAARLAEQADGIQQTHWWSCELRDLFSLPPDPPTPWKPRG